MTLSCKDLTINLNQLTEQFTQLKTTMADQIAEYVRATKSGDDTAMTNSVAEQVQAVKAEYDIIINDMRRNHENEIQSLRNELNAVIKATSGANLDTVMRFFKLTDDKVDRLLLQSDIMSHDAGKLKSAVENDVTKLQNMINEMKRGNNEQSVTTKNVSERSENVRREERNDDEIHENGRMIDKNFECIKRLEQRIDNLEDHSRRDNLLFYGFPEDINENCGERVKELICNKILPDNIHVNGIKFVRAHRLGKYDGRNEKPRAIIVKFREFNERMDVFMSKKKLKGTPYAVTEDFSTNTNNEREFLEGCIKTAKAELGPDMEAGFLRYKTLIIKDNKGRFNRFSANYINRNPQNWWMKVLNVNEWRSQESVRKNRAHQAFRQALMGDIVPPADEEIVESSDVSNRQPVPEPNLPAEDRDSDPVTTVEMKEPAIDNPVEAVVDEASG